MRIAVWNETNSAQTKDKQAANNRIEAKEMC
jgi:hypothetical protein